MKFLLVAFLAFLYPFVTCADVLVSWISHERFLPDQEKVEKILVPFVQRPNAPLFRLSLGPDASLRNAAGRASFQTALKTAIGQMAAGDRLTIHISGHGLCSGLLRDWNHTTNTPVLNLYPEVAQVIAETTLFAGSPVGSLDVFVDSCFSGQILAPFAQEVQALRFSGPVRVLGSSLPGTKVHSREFLDAVKATQNLAVSAGQPDLTSWQTVRGRNALLGLALDRGFSYWTNTNERGEGGCLPVARLLPLIRTHKIEAALAERVLLGAARCMNWNGNFARTLESLYVSDWKYLGTSPLVALARHGAKAPKPIQVAIAKRLVAWTTDETRLPGMARENIVAAITHLKYGRTQILPQLIELLAVQPWIYSGATNVLINIGPEVLPLLEPLATDARYQYTIPHIKKQIQEGQGSDFWENECR